MSAEVETMMYVREKPWHGLGTRVEEALCSADAMQISGLDWRVVPQPILLSSNGMEIPNYKANVRDIDNKVLGIVTDRYKIVQNEDAFAFTDELISGDVRYETAGSLLGGKRIWLLAKMPKTNIVGDEVEPYLCFTNTHDGTGSVRVCMTPVRVVCNNTLNMALNSAKRSWSVRHIGNINDKLEAAKESLDFAGMYMEELAKKADDLANTTMTNDQVKAVIDSVFSVPEDASDRQKANAQSQKEQFTICYFAPDIIKFQNTAWGVINAAADMADHQTPLRSTKNFQENNWGKIMYGHPILDKVAELVTANAMA